MHRQYYVLKVPALCTFGSLIFYTTENMIGLSH